MPKRPTIGLLVCDHLDAEVVDVVGGDYDDLLFPQLLGPLHAELRCYDAVDGVLPVSPSECDAWVTTGSRHSAMDEDQWIINLGAFLVDVVESERPLVAICFGHQLLARAMGGAVVRAEQGWGIGPKRFVLSDPPDWLSEAGGTFEVLMSHRDQVVEVPVGARVFATSQYCPVGAYVIGENVFSVQGHPEFVASLSRILIERRRGLIDARVCDEALERLGGAWSDEEIKRGVVAFLDQRLGDR